MGGSILTDPQLIRDIRNSNKGKRIVFTNGCFDLLHAGHITYLKEAASLGDIFVIGINTDESVSKLKGEKRPLVELKFRAAALADLGFVDFVIPFGEDTPIKLIVEITPHVLVKGGDYTSDDIVGAEHTKSNGGEVITIPFVHKISTSIIIDKITKRYCK